MRALELSVVNNPSRLDNMVRKPAWHENNSKMHGSFGAWLHTDYETA